ncbi:MAG: ABC transporter permease [Acidimicrobiia bacterium]|nr:ABC transporter permease [Acidimicrobiia bacterium]MDH4308664.1 ABC transporter permease [Acidimicrobiia bacterium]MDH5293994.1 ABC transporter permease [Acidimicrobiia bacterium]
MTSADSEAALFSVNAPLSSRDYLRAMWSRREFAIALPVESMRSAHRTTLFGSLWHLGTPLLTVLTYYLVFGKLLKVDKGIDHYLIWLTIGVFSFRLSQASVTAGSTSINANNGLIRSMRFPRALLPASAVGSELMGFGFELAIIGAMSFAAVGASRRWLVLPFLLVVHTALNLGFAFVAARLNDMISDVQRLIPFAFRLLQYVSGVMFPIQALIEAEPGEHVVLAKVVAWNPLLRIIDTYRWVFLGTPLTASDIARTSAIAALCVWFGFRYFRAAEHRYGQ